MVGLMMGAGQGTRSRRARQEYVDILRNLWTVVVVTMDLQTTAEGASIRQKLCELFYKLLKMTEILSPTKVR